MILILKSVIYCRETEAQLRATQEALKLRPTQIVAATTPVAATPVPKSPVAASPAPFKKRPIVAKIYDILTSWNVTFRTSD